MKKLLSLLLGVILVFALVLGLASCSGNDSTPGGGGGTSPEYKITFVSDGKIYSTVKTSGNEIVRMPRNPEKTGYSFAGWYLDENSYDRPFSASYPIENPLTSDITVYAGWYASDVTLVSRALSVDGKNLSATVRASEQDFSFASDITVTGGAVWVVSLDVYGMQTVATKTVPLAEGANRFYIHVTNPDQSVDTYTVDIYRNHLYTVTFDTLGGSYVEPQYIEEGYYASEPYTARVGYYLAGWDYSFSTPITSHTVITASWTPRSDTAYKVEYYLADLDGGYPKAPSVVENLTGTTATTVYAEQSFNGFSIDSYKHNRTSGTVAADGSLVLTVYYARDRYTVTAGAENSKAGTVSGGGTYSYEKTITLTATTSPGYTFLGWYEGTELVSSSAVYTFEAEKTVSYTAKWEAGETTYTVNHYKSTFTKNGYVTELIQSETISAITGDMVEAIEKTLSGYTLSEDKSVMSGEVAYDGSLVLSLYYDGGAQYIREENYIYFGEYPQSLKAEGVTITSTTDSRGYYLGSDGFYYAKVTAKPCDSGYTFSTGATVSSGSVYYFKVESIRWRILSESHESALILCDSIIANKAYDSSSNNYKNSDIRAWLNEQFYKTAFSELQRELIITTTVDNSVQSTGYSSNPYACENTEDKIFLLSYSEVTNAGYGFASSSSTYDTARRMLTSDYSRATGVYMNTSSSYYGNGYWWLRSPNVNGSGDARSVTGAGFTSGYYYGYVYYDDDGVVPALQIRL